MGEVVCDVVGVVVGALEYDGVVSGSVVVLARTHATRFRLPARPHYVPPLRKPPPLLRLANETHYDCTPCNIVRFPHHQVYIVGWCSQLHLLIKAAVLLAQTRQWYGR